MAVNIEEIPIRALRPTTRKKLSSMLNGKKRIRTSDGICRDYRGLALLMTKSRPDVDFDYFSRIAMHNEPTASLLEMSPHKLGEFRGFLRQMDRLDVWDDCRQLFHEDALAYAEELRRRTLFPMPAIRNPYLTIDDIIESGLKYDAFLLYADADREFAAEIVKRLEDPPRTFNVCVRDRLLGTVIFEHRSIMTLIAEHCHRLIVILSDDFVEDYEHTFFLNFGEHLAIKHPKKSDFILPIVYRDCELPSIYSFRYNLDYRRESKLFNFWEHLYKSLPRIPSEAARIINSRHEGRQQPSTENTGTSSSVEIQSKQDDFSPHHEERRRLNTENTRTSSSEEIQSEQVAQNRYKSNSRKKYSPKAVRL